MNPHAHQPPDQYMFLITGYSWHEGMPPADARKAIDAMMAWVSGLLEQGIASTSSPLARMGKIVAGKNGSSITDGPFAESKEVVGGYIIITAPNVEAAAAIAAGCPLLEFGVTLDVRQMVNQCAIEHGLIEEAARTAAAA